MINTSEIKIECKKTRISGFIHISEIIDDVMEDISKKVSTVQKLANKTSSQTRKKRIY